MPRFRGAGAAAAATAAPSAFSYQARLIVEPTIEAALTAYARLYGTAQQYLLAATVQGADPDQIKPALSRQHGLTACQFNAISVSLKGKIAGIKERRSGLIEEAAARIRQAQDVIRKVSKQPRKPKQSKVGAARTRQPVARDAWPRSSPMARTPRSTALIPVRNGGHLTLALPERNRA